MAMAGAAVALVSTPAFASGPPASSKVPRATVPIGKFTAGTPFSSGQVIEVKIPANSKLTPGAGIKIVECAAPHGVVPTDPSECDGTTIQGDTVLVKSDGSVDYTRTSTSSGYTVYALPDVRSLGERPAGQPVCNATHQCVLYIGQNQLDFTAPHYWSQPFEVRPTPGDTGTHPGDGALGTAVRSGGSSNALLTIGLPVVVVVVGGGALLFLGRRRRRSEPAHAPREPIRTSVQASGRSR
jgi:hypothetical protein